MKKIQLVFILVLVTTRFSYSQNSFYFEWYNNSDNNGLRIIESDNSIYIIANKAKNSIITPTIYKITPNGEMVDSIEYRANEGMNCNFNSFLVNENDDLFVIGSTEKENSDFHDLLWLSIDENLNILTETFYPVNGGYMDYTFGFFNNHGAFSIASLIEGNPPNPGMQFIDKMILEINQDGDVIYDSIYNQSNFEIVYDFIPLTNSNNSLLFCYKNFDGGSQSKYINILDQDYSLVESYSIDNLGTAESIRNININEYLISGRSFEGDFWHPIVKKYDENFIEVGSVQFNNSDTSSYPAKYNSLIIGNNQNFSSFTYNIDISTFYSTMHSYININSFDNDLNISWQNYYGGDAYYYIYDITSAQDGGVLLIGTKYSNGITGPFEREIFILKVDENGLITSTNKEESIPIKNAIITPNPGKDYLQLHTGIFPAALQMFDINGKLILEEEINQNSTTIHTQSLSSGTYIWQLLKDGQVVETDKWVKE